MKRTLIALTLVATTAFSGLAHAGGTITFHMNATNSHDANAIRTGLTLYQIARDIDANGHISQNGINNIASLAQGGHGNIGVIHQDGNNHNGSIYQNGNNNSCGLFQFGRGTNGHINQTGNGQACLMFQAGF